MTFRTLAAAIALCLVAAFPAAAQQTPPAYGPPITLEMAKKVMAGAEAEATKSNWNVFIVIVDSGGNIVMLHRFDNTQLGSLPLAKGKAQTALDFKLPTKALEDAISAGGAGLRLTTLNNITPLEGGLPIVADGKIIGAIGVSGVLSAQDAQIARAGIQALGNSR
jgi:glc operon protein GlcG